MTTENMKFEPEKVVEISMLGEFRVTIGDKSICSAMNRSKKMWYMLQYLIIMRNKKVTKQELIDRLWANEQSQKPEYALKTLSYRLRKTLKLLEEDYASELIIPQEGGYSWNNTYKCRVDVDEFEEFCRKGDDETKEKLERIALYKEAFNIYKGNFLAAANHSDQWILSMQAYYRNMYIRTICNLLELLQELKEYELIYEIGTAFVGKEDFDEKVCYYLMDALVNQGKSKEAIAYYEYITHLFYREYGTRPGEKITMLYYRAIKETKPMTSDLFDIQSEMNRQDSSNGVYYCAYEVFKHLYQIEARQIERREKASYLILMSIADMNPDKSAVSLEQKMTILLEIVGGFLRRGDTISRYSASQYILLLPYINEEEIEIVVKRMADVIRKKNSKIASCLEVDFMKVQSMESHS